VSDLVLEIILDTYPSFSLEQLLKGSFLTFSLLMHIMLLVYILRTFHFGDCTLLWFSCVGTCQLQLYSTHYSNWCIFLCILLVLYINVIKSHSNCELEDLFANLELYLVMTGSKPDRCVQSARSQSHDWSSSDTCVICWSRILEHVYLLYMIECFASFWF
jgi:hypothetical protein